jgi:hypothetical protein
MTNDATLADLQDRRIDPPAERPEMTKAEICAKLATRARLVVAGDHPCYRVCGRCIAHEDEILNLLYAVLATPFDDCAATERERIAEEIRARALNAINESEG